MCMLIVIRGSRRKFRLFCVTLHYISKKFHRLRAYISLHSTKFFIVRMLHS